MTCTITNGTYSADLSQWIAFKGFKVYRHDVEGSNGGTTLGGTTIRDVLGTKRKIDVTCRPMPQSALLQILRVLDGDEGFYCSYTDVQNGSVRLHMHSNDYSWTTHRSYQDSDYYCDLMFTMEEY